MTTENETETEIKTQNQDQNQDQDSGTDPVGYKSEFLSAENSLILQKVLVEMQYVEGASFTDATNCMGDLGLDSLDMIEVVMAMEDEFNIELPDSMLPPNMESITVGFIAELVSKQLAALSLE